MSSAGFGCISTDQEHYSSSEVLSYIAENENKKNIEEDGLNNQLLPSSLNSSFELEYNRREIVSRKQIK